MSAIVEEFVRKTASFSESAKGLKSGAESETNHPLDVDFDSLSTHIENAQTNLANMHQTLNLLLRDFSRVQSILQDLHTRTQQHHQPLDSFAQTFTALQHLHEIHQSEYIPSLETTWTHITSLLSILQTSKLHSTSALRSRLQSISHLQTTLSNTLLPAVPRLAAIQTNMTQAFSQLLHVHRMPAAWGAVMVEVVRRREFVRCLVERGEVVAGAFGKVVEAERKRREGFDGEIGRYLPRGGDGKAVVKGLGDGVGKVEVRIVKGVKEGLPKIGRKDLVDLEKFISQIRAAMSDMDPSSSMAAANLTSSHASSIGNPAADSISKLQATLSKMMPQIDAVSPDFDRVLTRAGVCGERVAKLEEENARLKAELKAVGGGSMGGGSTRASAPPAPQAQPPGVVMPSTSVPVSSHLTRRNVMANKTLSAGNFEGDWSKAEDTIRAYENRIKTLEDLLQQSFLEKSHLMNASTLTPPTLPPTPDPTLTSQLHHLQTENATLRARITTLESSPPPLPPSAADALHQQTQQHVAQMQEKDTQGRLVVTELERCARFVREVSELLDDCSQAFKVRNGGSSSLGDAGGGGGEGGGTRGWNPTVVQQNAPRISTATSTTPSSLSKYQSPTSPSVGLLAIVNAAQSFSTSASLAGVANQGTDSHTPPAALNFTATLSTLRTDERDIRRRLRELQDDIRCQTLELVGMEDELIAMQSGANGGVMTDSGAYPPQNVYDVATSPRSTTEQSRSGMSIPGGGGGGVIHAGSGGRLAYSLVLEELHASKRETQRLTTLVQELQDAMDSIPQGMLGRCEELEREVLDRAAQVERLQEEAREWEEERELMWMKVERVTGALGAVQVEKGVVEKRLEEVVGEVERLEGVVREVAGEWEGKVEEGRGVVRRLAAGWGGGGGVEGKVADGEAGRREVEKEAEALQVMVQELEGKLRNAESARVSGETAVWQKETEVARLEDTCERLRVANGRERGKIVKLKEKIEDWGVVCKMAMECLAGRFESLASVGGALVEMDGFVRRYIEEAVGVSSARNGAESDGNPLLLKLAAMNSFRANLNQSSSLSNSVDDEHEFSEAAESRLPQQELRETYLEMIQLIDSIDIGTWSDAVVRSCHNWKELILTQSLRKAIVREDLKISFSSFKAGDLALFLPTRNPKTWAAFNVNTPHYFLSIASAETHFAVQIKNKDWILAVIGSIEPRQAGKGPEGGPVQNEANPFGLAVGTKYFWCIAEPVNHVK
ncbi:oligomeric, coiled-coil, peripheral membrane protein [Podochytrium sp. JEL0797]|nr:oligomeric, coiled-coil, peripheral membrane protein [Podochytrium sp. JEL0797]KAJ3073703.1 oligomeric, coiled-coil, peripheral membrane protein [Podochytrium sp. JEL0797]